MVKFASAALEAKVREEIGVPDGALTLENLAILTLLEYPGQKIHAIDGIECAQELLELQLDGNEIESIDPVRWLHKLEILSISNNDLGIFEMSLEPLRDLDNLRDLQIFAIGEGDIGPLASLDELESPGSRSSPR